MSLRRRLQAKEYHRRQMLKMMGAASLAGSLPACGPLASDELSSLKGPVTYPIENPSASRLLPKDKQRRVLIIGAGLAGLTSALHLAEAGYEVVLQEAAPYAGGRLHTRQEELKVGTFQVEHGLHMWFHHYFMCREILENLGSWDKYFRPFNEVFFQFEDYEPELIASKGPFPLNLGRIVLASPNLNMLNALQTFGGVKDVLFYNHDQVYEKFDHLTFKEWAKQTRVHQKFYDIIMEPAASVTLNDPDQISAAEMILYMHYYFMGDAKAFYRHIPQVDHGRAVINPWLARLESLGVQIRLGQPATGLRAQGQRVLGLKGDDETFDEVILATDVPAAKALLAQMESADDLAHFLSNQIQSRMAPLEVAPRYHVLRVYLDRPTRPRPASEGVVETPQFHPINLVAFYHMLEEESAAWAQSHGGSVIELHLYNTPEFISLSAHEIWKRVWPQMRKVSPELEGARLLDAVVGSFENFTSFAVGQGRLRPERNLARQLGWENLGLAGDWVHTRYPSALMERAVATGREAANDILLKDGVRQVAITAASSRGKGHITF